MSMNRYVYAAGNPVNRIDPSGLFSCDAESPAVAGACEELNTALQRATSQQITFPGTLYQNLMNNRLPFWGLETSAQDAFGVEFGYLTAADEILVNTCASVSKQYEDSVKRTLIRTVAAFVHVVSRLAEAGISDPTTKFREKVGRVQPSIRFHTQGGPGGAGRGETLASSNYMRLGTEVTVATIVHELGHFFERAFGNPIRAVLAANGGVLVGQSGAAYNNLNPAAAGSNPIGLPRADRPNTGLGGRANTSGQAGEFWPDMFMNWVLDKHYQRASSQFEIYVGTPGYECKERQQANFNYAFTHLAVKYLLDRGSLPKDVEFIKEISNNINPPQGFSVSVSQRCP